VKIKAIKLVNFRSYRGEVTIPIDNFTVLIGKNEAGKSSVLEALEIFFNNTAVKFDASDCNVHSDDRTVSITCVFSDLPDVVTIDAGASTSLEQEFLLNEDSDLEIQKKFNCSTKTVKASTFAVAFHPSKKGFENLLGLKNGELKAKLSELGLDDKKVNKSVNSEMRKAIWASEAELEMSLTEVPLDEAAGKEIWTALSSGLPIFALFQSDRKSTHEDREVQDPMSFAIAEALKEVEPELELVKKKVESRVIDVAERTLKKLREMDAELADELTPRFKADPKWSGLFKVTLEDQHEIPIDKRGSGARRLILLNFFRAEAERRLLEQKAPGVIYAIEEPETSQHPNNQRLIVESLLRLADAPNTQVLITTHVPALAGLVPVESLRFIQRTVHQEKFIRFGNEEMYKEIADTLGLLPDKRVQLLLCVEGPNDVAFLKAVSKTLSSSNGALPDLEREARIAIIPLGGSTLQEWVAAHYLKSLNLPEFHIYDRDEMTPPKYQEAVNHVNGRRNGDFATLTSKREMENYIHPAAIRSALSINISFNDTDDVSTLVAQKIHETSNSGIEWDSLAEKSRKEKESQAKKLLNRDAVPAMTIEQLRQIDSLNEIEGWFINIASRLV
jgi:predicted ATP-dependent endonuclease of OLD family